MLPTAPMHDTPPLRHAARVILTKLCGTNPWPAAGSAGYAAAITMQLAALVLLIAMGVAAARGVPHEGLIVNDFIAYLTGSAILAEADLPHLYDPERQWQVQTRLVESIGSRPLWLNTFGYPPLWAAIMMPLLPLGVMAGLWVWRLMTLLISLTVLSLVARPTGTWQDWLRPTALLLCFAPFLESWHAGQITPLLLGAFGGWFALSRAQHPRLAGLVLSLTLFKPTYAPIPVLFLVWKRQWSQLVGFGLGAAAQVLATLAMVGALGVPTLDTLRFYLEFGGGQASVEVDRQLNLRALVWHALPDPPASTQLVVLGGLTLLLIGGFLLACGRAWQPDRRRFAWEVLALGALVCLTAYHNHADNLYVMLPPLAILLADNGEGEEEYGWQTACLPLLLAAPSVGFLYSMSFGPPYLLGAWVAAIGVLALGLAACRRRTQAARLQPGRACRGVG